MIEPTTYNLGVDVKPELSTVTPTGSLAMNNALVGDEKSKSKQSGICDNEANSGKRAVLQLRSVYWKKIRTLPNWLIERKTPVADVISCGRERHLYYLHRQTICP